MPRRAVKTAEIEGPAAFDFSKSLQKLTPDSFFRFVREYPASEGTSTYIYRIEPEIDRSLAGVNTSYIEVTTAPLVDDDYLLRRHGSGRYHIKFSDANRPRGTTEVAKTTVHVYDPHVEPKLNPIELVVSAPKNDVYIRQYLSQGWTVENGRLRPPASSGSSDNVLAKTVSDLAQQVAAKPPAAAAPGTESLIRDMFQGMQAELAALRAHVMGGQKPLSSQVGELVQVVQMMKPDTQFLDLFRQTVMDRKNKSSLEELREQVAAMRELGLIPRDGGGMSGSGAGNGTDWAAFFGGLLSAAPQTLMAWDAFEARRARRKTGVVDPPPPAAAIAGATETAVESAEVDEPEEPEQTEQGEMMQMALEVAEDALDAFDRGISGAEFAKGLCNGRRGGTMIFGVIKKMGREAIMGMIPMAAESNEDLARKLADPAQKTLLETFVRDAFAYEPAQ